MLNKYIWEVNLRFDYRLSHGGVATLKDYLDHWRGASFSNTYQHVLISRRENLTYMKITEGHSWIPKYLFDSLGTKWSALQNRSWNPRQMEKDFSTICGMKLRRSNWILLVLLRCITNWLTKNHCLQQCDLLLQDVLPTNERQQVVDITVPWVYTSVALLMHAPDESANINAITKPFQWPVKRKKKKLG